MAQTARTLDLVSNLPPVPTNKDGKIDVAKWAHESAIPTDQFMDLGSIPNFQMPQVLREMDVGIFPNRCEGGTNLVAMECMACGMPVILWCLDVSSGLTFRIGCLRRPMARSNREFLLP
jgi:hypothetical protein